MANECVAETDIFTYISWLTNLLDLEAFLKHINWLTNLFYLDKIGLRLITDLETFLACINDIANLSQI